MRLLQCLLIVMTLLAVSRPLPAYAQDRAPEPAAGTREMPAFEAPGEDGTAGHWEFDCWEAPDEEMIYCEDVWISSGPSGDWDGEGAVTGSDF